MFMCTHLHNHAELMCTLSNGNRTGVECRCQINVYHLETCMPSIYILSVSKLWSCISGVPSPCGAQVENFFGAPLTKKISIYL